MKEKSGKVGRKSANPVKSRVSACPLLFSKLGRNWAKAIFHPCFSSNFKYKSGQSPDKSGQKPSFSNKPGQKRRGLARRKNPSKYRSALPWESAPHFLERLRSRIIITADQTPIQTKTPPAGRLLSHHNIIAGWVWTWNRIHSTCHTLGTYIAVSFRNLPSAADTPGRRGTENINSFFHAFLSPSTGLEMNLTSLTGTQHVFGTLSPSHVIQTATVSRISPRISVTTHC